ncbi:hypothetical protein LTR36_007693 [Oleoguttula mirabilis]|uniref:GH16 domain-containing protein n=1 Tax=Oleoguttula mirabilis TaxID=1507867 RepID=A0AAV9JUJ7_9PEZI|nr:hypothetical protein LTR36_007693 [Oleoguttula mirabilis]
MFATRYIFTALTAASFATIGRTAPTTTQSSAASNYSLVADFSGSSFFDGFTTFVGADPTEGNVNYVGMKSGAENGLLGFIDNQATNSVNAYIGVDYQNVTASRNSIRLSSKQTFDAGTVITFDFIHAPVAYGTWPALWMLGDVPGAVWPDAGGEADILEWVHESSFNSMTLHTAPGCTVLNSTSTFQGQLQNSNCNAGSGSDGCSIEALSQAANGNGKTLATAGAAFNDQGGAVYAVDWRTSGLSVYMFARDNLPADLAAGKPDPSSWSVAPLAAFSGSGCDFTTSLSKMQIIEDITFCGAWAGKPDVWQSSGAAAATKTSTCSDYVMNNPKAFKDAYFEIASIRVYSSTGAEPGTATSAKRDLSAESLEFQTINIGDRHNITDGSDATAPQPIGAQNATNGTGHGHHFGHHHHGHFNGTYHHGNQSAYSTGMHITPPQPQSTTSLAAMPEKNGVTIALNNASGIANATSGSAALTDFSVSSAECWAGAALIAFAVAALI